MLLAGLVGLAGSESADTSSGMLLCSLLVAGAGDVVPGGVAAAGLGAMPGGKLTGRPSKEAKPRMVL